MEFANSGAHCQRCGRQDFLPIPCSVCQGVFCSKHAQHSCKTPFPSSSENIPILQSRPCCICSATSSKIDLICESCQKPICLQHRLPEDHQCPTNATKSRLPAGRGSAAIQAARSRLGLPEIEKKPKEKKAKSAKAQAVVNGMKIKFKAIGEESIPPLNRLYVSVDIRSVNTRKEMLDVFLDKRRTIGHAIDQICRLGNIRNENNLTTGRRLLLRPRRDLIVAAFQYDVILGAVEMEIYDGDVFELISEIP